MKVDCRHMKCNKSEPSCGDADSESKVQEDDVKRLLNPSHAHANVASDGSDCVRAPLSSKRREHARREVMRHKAGQLPSL